MATRLLALVLVLALVALAGLAPAWAQRQAVTLELGFAGEVVAGRWNPLRLSLRDVTDARLTLLIDQGSLRGGEILAEYSADIRGGSGLSVFEDDVFIPTWRSLTWRLSAGERLLASGGFDRRLHDSRPLTLLVSSRLSPWQTALPEARLVAVAASELPGRLAAYDGVERMILDGTTAAPSLEALVAASAAGTAVLLGDALPESYAATAPLLGSRLGAGRVGRSAELYNTPDAAPDASESEAVGFAPSELAAALLTRDLLEPPPQASNLMTLGLLAGYAALVLLMLRFAGLPGLVGSLALAALLGFVGWQAARPHADQRALSRSLIVSAGELGREDRLETFFTHPARALELPLVARPLHAAPYRQRGSALTIGLGRWQTLALQRRPRLVQAPLAWDGARLVNRSGNRLEDVFVLGLGRQAPLDAGSSASPTAGEDEPLDPVFAALLERLAQVPGRVALARQGETFVIALPPTPLLTGGLP